MKVLVTAATKYGATGEIAQTIGEVFAERGWDAVVVPPEQVQGIDSFDAALRVPEGDVRDWADVKAWAAEIADAQRPGT